MSNKNNVVPSNYEYIEWTDTEVTSKCASVLYDFKDFAKYYAFAFVSFDLSNLVKAGNYKELGCKCDSASSFVCFGNHNFCICFMNAETRHIVRQMTVNYFMITGILIKERTLETIIKIYLKDDVITMTIPNKALGTKLNHQKQMKENITELTSSLYKISKE